MVDHDNLFSGHWKLIPELCQYQEGAPPASCIYKIAHNGDTADFALSWSDKDGKIHNVSYGGPTDGSVIPFKGGHVNEMSFSRVDANTLDSSAYSQGREVSYSRRKASPDGLLLSVQLVQRRNGNASTRNFQVFRRLI